MTGLFVVVMGSLALAMRFTCRGWSTYLIHTYARARISPLFHTSGTARHKCADSWWVIIPITHKSCILNVSWVGYSCTCAPIFHISGTRTAGCISLKFGTCDVHTYVHSHCICIWKPFTKVAPLPKEGIVMAGETGGGTGRDLPLRAPLIPLPGWDPGTQYITKWALFTSLWLFFSNCNSCIGGSGPFETLRDPFPRGPQGLVPPPL